MKGMQTRSQTQLRYIGMSLEDARRIASPIQETDHKKASNAIEKLFEPLGLDAAPAIIARWWASPPGTALTVGWMHSDAIEYDDDDEADPTVKKYAFAVVVRPSDDVLHRPEDVDELFEYLLRDAVSEVP